MLVSPELLFQTGSSGSLDGLSLARRLSAFLWRSLPDEELVRLAVDDNLTNPVVLAAQVDRMLADPKSTSFTHVFLDLWLGICRFDETTPDAYLYPEYDDVLRRAMLDDEKFW